MPSKLELLTRAVRNPWMMRISAPLFGEFHPFLPAYRLNPYPTFRRLRERHPIYRHPLLESWLVSRHADIVSLLADSRMSVARGESDLFRKYMPFAEADPRVRSTLFKSLLMIDPPDHTRIRGLVQKAFTPRSIQALEPRIVEIVDEHLARIPDHGPFDLLETFAVPVPLTVVCELLGVPVDRLDDLKRWSSLLTELLDPISVVGALERSRAVIGEIAAFFAERFDERRRDPGDDLLSALVQAEHEGDRLDGEELVSLVALLLAAGHETTTSLIANAVLALEGEPALRRRLVEEPAVAGRATEELLRFDSPVQLTDRVATGAVELDGHTFRKGEMVVLLLGSGNRDPAAFPHPDRLDFDRETNPHLSLGHGIHFCVGAALARLEARVALPRLFRSLGGYRVDRTTLEYGSSLVLRGPSSLRVQRIA